jgi:hypothetical protein
LQKYLEDEHSVEIYGSATADFQGERVAGDTLRIYWLDPLVAMLTAAMEISP